MFKNILKTVFKKKENVEYNSDISIDFKDLLLQSLHIEIKPTGNETMLTITEQKSNTTIALDKEQCLLLGTIFAEYGKTGSINRVKQLIDEEGNN